MIKQLKRQANEAEEEYDEKRASICNAIANYLERIYKNVNWYIDINKNFFKRLGQINEVDVIGHSFGNVDMPYFKEIKNNVKPDAVWKIYYYKPEERNIFRDRTKSIGIKDKYIDIEPSEMFW